MEIEHLGYTIKPKLDFGPHGFLIDGKLVKEGFVVIKDSMNVMPGATWFVDFDQAKLAIEVLVACGGDANDPFKVIDVDTFWKTLQEKLKAQTKINQDTLNEVLNNMKGINANVSRMAKTLDISIKALQLVASAPNLTSASTTAVKALLEIQKIGDSNDALSDDPATGPLLAPVHERLRRRRPDEFSGESTPVEGGD